MPKKKSKRISETDKKSQKQKSHNFPIFNIQSPSFRCLHLDTFDSDDKNERESYADVHGIASMTGMFFEITNENIGLYEFMWWTLWKTL